MGHSFKTINLQLILWVPFYTIWCVTFCNSHFLTMRELQEKLKLSRQTITRYIKAGLPRIKKGHENLFDFNEVSKWIERNDSTSYAKLMYEAQELYPDEPLRVLEYVKF